MLSAILTQWSFDPSITAGLICLWLIYWRYSFGPRAEREGSAERRHWSFAVALILAFLALESPLDVLADRYLFSAHMAQHLVLMLAVAPLLALAVPPGFAAAARRRIPAAVGKVVAQPVAVFLAFVVDVWTWHAPPLYEATLHNEGIHVLEHLSFIALAALFWWIALAPIETGRQLPALARVAYVFVAGIPNTLLGALITFAPSVLYPSYQLALEQPGLGRALQTQWGITALGDQQLGGLLMWVPGGFVYLLAIVGIFISWFSRRQPLEPQAVT
jgi:cytochrome c oxidase assembly factor CtaG